METEKEDDYLYVYRQYVDTFEYLRTWFDYCPNCQETLVSNSVKQFCKSCNRNAKIDEIIESQLKYFENE